MELNNDTWRHKFTSMKAAKGSTIKSRFRGAEKPDVYVNPVEKNQKQKDIVSNASTKNSPAVPPKAFKNKLLTIYQGK